LTNGRGLGTTTLEASVIREGVYIASADLGSLDVDFTDAIADESEVFTATTQEHFNA
jgi:hypothetical protein